MLVAYAYKLSPSHQQMLVMEKHLEMLRHQYNFRINERTEAYEQAFFPKLGHYCDLKTKAECCPLACSVSKNALYGSPWTAKGKKRGALAQQDADLPKPHQLVIWTLGIILLTHIMGALLRPGLRPATPTPPGKAPRTENATLGERLWGTRTLSRPKI